MTPVNRDALQARLLAVFLEELEEQGRALEADLLALEQQPADAERLRSVFRVAHTLKGAARAAGVPEVEALCHALEAMLSDVRDGCVPLDAPRLAVSLAASDALAESARRLRAGQPVGDATAAALAKLRAPMEATPPVPHPAPEPRPVEPPPPPAAPAPDPGPREPAHDDERIRVAVAAVAELQASVAQLLGHAAALDERPAALRALLDDVVALQGEGQDPELLRRLHGVARRVASLVRAAEDDARAVGSVSARLGDEARRLRLRPFAELAAALPRVVRDVAQAVGKEVQLEIEGQDVEADRTVLDALRDPLLHLVRNAIDHGLEPAADRARAGKPPAGTLHVAAAVAGERLRVTVRDDGRGLDVAAAREALRRRGRPVPADDREVARALFEGGVSTRAVATAISGRGVGLDVVGATAARLGGSVDVHWRAGEGTTFVLELPLSLATTRALVVDAGDARVAVPTAAVRRVLRVAPAALRRVGPRIALPVGDELLPVLSLAGRLGARERGDAASGNAPDALLLLLLVAGDRRAAVRVDDVHEEREFVARPLVHAGAAAAARYAGAVLRGADEVLPLVAPAWVLAGGVRGRDVAPAAGPELAPPRQAPEGRARVLVVDDSITTRALESSVLEAAGFDVRTAVDGVEALEVLGRGGIDLVVTDIEMPRMDGIALCEAIRRTPRLASLPVVVVTSLDRPEQRARGMEAGADAYVTKSSFDQDDFLTVARQLVAGRGGAP